MFKIRADGGSPRERILEFETKDQRDLEVQRLRQRGVPVEILE
jgi:hypothetical protein